MSSIKLFKGVPWGSDGLNILRFPNQAAQTAYFDSLETYVPKEEINYDPRRGAVLTLQESLFDAREFNYLAWYDDNDNPLYFFIEDYEYLNDNPTVALQITEDVWQNTQFKIKINNSKVHRRHMPRWNGSQPILYPVDEGKVRTETCIKTQRLDDQYTGHPNVYAVLIITNKQWQTEAQTDGLFYYLTFSNITTPTAGKVHADDGYWIDPTNTDFLQQLALAKIGTNTIVGIYIVPIFKANVIYSTSTDGVFRFINGGSTFQLPGATDYLHNITNYAKPQATIITTEFEKPAKNTSSGVTASPAYEPQVYADNVRRNVLTDPAGYPLLEIPANLAWNADQITVYPEIRCLSPQLRLVVGDSTSSTVANGMECVIPLPMVDIANSNWLNYTSQERAQQQSILENNISSRYTQAAISLITGAGAGAAMGGLYSESFGNPKRSPGMAAAAGGAMNIISGIGSLANSYVQAGTDRDNFRLNEQMIKNKPAPPLGGSNPSSLVDEGIALRTFEGDDISKNIIWSQYKYAGVIVDQFMPVTLRTRYYYDFIQTQNISISGNINNAQRSLLEAMFNQGVTVWHSETFTGFNYNYDNIEV